MPLLEPVNSETLRKYPYFWSWLEELERSPEDVRDFAVNSEVEEIPSDTPLKKFRPTDNYTASILFKNGDRFDRHGKWSDGKMIYTPTENAE